MNAQKTGQITGYFLRDTEGRNKSSSTQKMDVRGLEKPAVNQNTATTSTVSSVCSDVTAGTMNNANDSVTHENVVSMAELKSLILGMEKKITSRLDRMEDELKSMKTDQRKLEEKIDGLEHTVVNTTNKVGYMETISLPAVKHGMEQKLKSVTDKITLMEIHNRKLNLLFYGVEQKPGEIVRNVIRDVWVSDFGMTDEEATDTEIVNAHRLPRKTPRPGPDPIIVRFAYMLDVEYFLNHVKNRPYNKDKKPVMVYTDLPPDLKQMRGKVVQEAKVLRQSGKQTRIRVVGTNVVLECRNKPRRGDPPGPWTPSRY